MRTRDLPMRLRWAGMIVVGLLCAAAAPAAAQQTLSSAPTAPQQASYSAPVTQASTAEANTPTANATLPGPRVTAPTFQPVEPIVPRGNASANSPPAPAENHTIVVSTLAVVLIAVIVVLLLVR